MEQRNRAAGWKHAKLSGHKNEDMLKDLLDNNEKFQKCFLERIENSNANIIKTSIGGIRERNVPSVNDRKTKSKTDLKVYLSNNEIINVSIKKSLTGQVYFVRASLFVNTFEKQFNTKIPNTVKRAIDLYWTGAEDAVGIIERYADKTNKRDFDLQIRHKSLNATTLKSYDERIHYALLEWFIDNAYEITKLSFSMGAVFDKKEWSSHVWYINLLEENNIDDIFVIEDICKAAKEFAQDETYYGLLNGGTTIQLPFGFVQWHQGKLQFHHDYNKLSGLLKKGKRNGCF